jgi:hypothetical protein
MVYFKTLITSRPRPNETLTMYQSALDFAALVPKVLPCLQYDMVENPMRSAPICSPTTSAT